MSTAGLTIPADQAYFCYQCNRTVTLSPSPNSDLACPNCHGGFLEEFDSSSLEPPSLIPSPFSSSMAFPDPFSLFADQFTDRGGRSSFAFSSTGAGLGNPRNSTPSLFGPTGHDYHDSGVAFNAFDFLRTYLMDLRASGANVQFVVDNQPSEGGLELPANIGDYVLGSGLEQLIQHLAENDPNRYGTPPASKRSVQRLPNVVITEELVKADSNSCAVCMNEFEVGLKVKQMPCAHLYHSDCLLPWLELHNSCPVCRYELPTDDPDYENRRVNQGQGNSSSAADGSGNGGTQVGGPRPSTVERRFRISLPWLFGSSASSGASDGGGSGNNNGSSSEGQQQSGGRGSEPRHESLD